MDILGPDRHKSVEPEQHRRYASDGPVRPLPLGLDAEMTADLGKGDLDGPASDEPGQDVLQASFLIVAQKGLGLEFAGRVAHQEPAQRHYGLAGVAPDRDTGGDLRAALVQKAVAAGRTADPRRPGRPPRSTRRCRDRW